MTKRHISALSVALLTLTPLNAAAQNVVGKSVVEGHPIELLSDFTWRYSNETSNRNCSKIDGLVSFCGNKSRWRPAPNPTGDADAVFMIDDAHYGQFIVERIGSDAGITMEFMRRIVIENAASFAKTTPKDVKVVQAEETSVEDQPAFTLVYSVEVNGVPIVIANTLVVLKTANFQISTFAISNSFTDFHSNLHSEFLSKTQFN